LLHPLPHLLSRPLSRWFFYWIDKRTPRSRLVQLTRKNLYIFPNLNGLLYGVMTLVIWLLGTNYQNNLILALSYLMLSLFIVAIPHTFANMAGVSVRFVSAKPAFAGEPATFVLELSTNHKRGCENLSIGWQNGESQEVSLKFQEPQQVQLRAPSKWRGYLRPGRLLVQSRFPLGIIRCWSWLNLDAWALIYPAPIAIDEPPPSAVSGREEGGNARRGGDDFSGLRDYAAGDPIKHIAWKQFAQNKGLFTKEYETLFSAEKWLDWNSLTQLQEPRLSGLCYWALQYDRQQIPYGLSLPGLTLAPALGDPHLSAVLAALAQFNLDPVMANAEVVNVEAANATPP
jgi:uncharacterized protein (DUF58 family)